MYDTKSKALLITTILALICNITVAQKKKTTSKTTTKNTASSINGITDQQAYAIIKYSNAVIDLHNSYVNALKSNQSTLDNYADQNVAKLKRNPNIQPFYIGCDRNSLPPESDKANRTTLKNIPAIPEKQNLQHLSTKALLHYDKTNTFCTEIRNYFSKAAYKNDTKFSQYTVLKDSMQSNIKQCRLYWNEFAQITSNAGDRAELVLLKKNKLAAYIIPMKESLNGLQQVSTMLNDENADLESINTKLATVQALITQKINDKNIDFSKLSDIYYKEVYTKFFRECNTTGTTLQTVIDKIKTKASQQNISSTYSVVSTSYNNAVQEYNTFIKQ